MSLVSFPSWGLSMDDLVEREGIYYKKFTDIPFTGKITGNIVGTLENGYWDGLYGKYIEGTIYWRGKYIKGKKESKYNENVLKYLSKYYEVSQREVIGYLDILTKDEITEIIKKYGIEDKEIKKWLK